MKISLHATRVCTVASLCARLQMHQKRGLMVVVVVVEVVEPDLHANRNSPPPHTAPREQS